MTSSKPAVGHPVPQFSLPRLGGGSCDIGGPRDRWSMLIVYRGKHCPRCKRYLGKLNDMLAEWEALVDLVVASADPVEKAAADRAEFGWNFTLCHDLSEDQMRALGLYVSDPISEAETDRRFAEPGTFVIKPDGTLMLVDISNGPASRPDLEELLDGVRFNISNDRPTRGMA